MMASRVSPWRQLLEAFGKFLVEQMGQTLQKPARVCRACFKPGEDAPVYYAYTEAGPCLRCKTETGPGDSVALANSL